MLSVNPARQIITQGFHNDQGKPLTFTMQYTYIL